MRVSGVVVSSHGLARPHVGRDAVRVSSERGTRRITTFRDLGRWLFCQHARASSGGGLCWQAIRSCWSRIASETIRPAFTHTPQKENMEAEETPAVEVTPNPVPTPPKPAVKEKKTGIALELEIMNKLTKLVADITDIRVLARIANWMMDIVNQKIEDERPAPTTGPQITSADFHQLLAGNR